MNQSALCIVVDKIDLVYDWHFVVLEMRIILFTRHKSPLD